MMTVKITSNDVTYGGTEIEVGQWAVTSEDLADFMDSVKVPESLTVLGGTLGLESDWHSPDTYVRAETFSWTVNRYLDDLQGPSGSRETLMIGVKYPEGDDLPAETVF